MDRLEYYAWWGEKVIMFVTKDGNIKSYYPERGQDQRWKIGADNPKLDTIEIAGVQYPIVGE